ncbi:MAG: methylglyoxal synthase [Deltaproteobacteria bacterium]|nr:methylglyoxal synthase [Deltaproteobacteria bacterium]
MGKFLSVWNRRNGGLCAKFRYNITALSKHDLYATGSTGKYISENCSINIHRLKSGPLGGDQQLGAMIANGDLDVLIFFWDPMTAQPHDVDVKALLRMSVLYNIPTACNRSTADFIISTVLLESEYEPFFKDYSQYITK